MRNNWKSFVLALGVSCGLIAGCEQPSENGMGGGGSAGTGYVVQIAGSSTVSPVSSAVAEEADNALGIKATVETTGTGPGMEKLSRKECDISGASRPIKDSEVEKCQANGVEPIEFEICIDGLSVVVNPENDWCECLSVDQLKKLWEYESGVKKWSDLNPEWPEEEIKLFGPDHESGTFDYFNEVIIGDVPEGQSPCRTDYTQSVNDTTLVDGVKGSKYALGYFGYAYYVMNKDQLKVIGIANKDDKSDCVAPSETTIGDGSYAPLSRPLFIYVNKEALQTKPEVKQFVEYYLNDGQAQVGDVGYIELPADRLEASRKKLAENAEGSHDDHAEEAAE